MAVDVTVRNDALINKDLIRQWLLWGLFWLMLFPTVGVIASTKFVFPDFLGRIPWLTFGRIRPIHVNGVIWGAYSTLFIGLSLYIVPRLAGARLWKEQWDFALLWVWRSEEHTSELQSQSNLVCRLLLEKKKTSPALHVLGAAALSVLSTTQYVC